MRYFSMFSGIGGFEEGTQRAYDVSNKQSTQIEQDGQGRNGDSNEVEHNVLSTSRTTPLCVGYSEIDKYAIKVYERHFNGHTNYGDATRINPTELPDFDLLVGGFPCQPFSIAGKRKGLDDTRGTLFFDIARILAEKRPRHLVLENVKGLLSDNKGKTFQTILGVLSELGYRVEWQVLNSKNFGVPQNRERVYIIGHLGNECGRKVFPIRQTSEQFNGWRKGVQWKIPDNTPIRTSINTEGKLLQDGENGHIYQINQPKHSNDRVYSDKGISPTLNTMQGGNRQPFVAAQRGRENGQVLEPQVEDRSNTLTAVAKDNYVVDIPRIRRLTPLECERLQGFPDFWTALDQDGNPISDTQRYKMCGNAVTVNVVEAVMRGLLPCMA